jgi:hypothetical protein
MQSISDYFDFDLAGIQVLNSRTAANNMMPYNDMDPIWEHPEGGILYVGNGNAAQNLPVLRAKHITHVVNCTHNRNKIPGEPNYHEDSLQYFEFKVASSY